MSNGINDLPLWAKLIEQWGFTAVLSVILLGVMFGWIPSPVLEELRLMKQSQQRQEYAQWHTLNIIRQICGSVTPEKERFRCEQWKSEKIE